MISLLRLLVTGMAALIVACRKETTRPQNIDPPPERDRFIRTDILQFLSGRTHASPIIHPPTSVLTRSPGVLRSFQGVSYLESMSGQLDTDIDAPEVNLQTGAAIFLRQAHANMTDGGISEEAMTSQWELLYYLSTVLKPPVLFAEGFQQNLSQEDVRGWLQQNATVQDRNLLDGLRDTGFPLHPSEELKRLVVRLRPAIVYSYLSTNPRVLLHRVMTPQEAELSERHRESMLARCGNRPALDRLACYRSEEGFVMHRREDWASREMSIYHRNNPSVPIAFIYGAAHTFCDDFTRREMGLKLVSVWATAAFDNSAFPICNL